MEVGAERTSGALGNKPPLALPAATLPAEILPSPQGVLVGNASRTETAGSPLGQSCLEFGLPAQETQRFVSPPPPALLWPLCLLWLPADSLLVSWSSPGRDAAEGDCMGGDCNPRCGCCPTAVSATARRSSSAVTAEATTGAGVSPGAAAAAAAGAGAGAGAGAAAVVDTGAAGGGGDGRCGGGGGAAADAGGAALPACSGRLPASSSHVDCSADVSRHSASDADTDSAMLLAGFTVFAMTCCSDEPVSRKADEDRLISAAPEAASTGE